MTTSDPQQILDRIRKNLRDADRDAFMGNLSHQARTEIPRLTEALEAVLDEVDGMREKSSLLLQGQFGEAERVGAFYLSDAAVNVRHAIESALTEEKS